MRLLKWVFFGMLGLLVICLGFAYRFVMQSPVIPLTQADFQRSGPDGPGEKEALIAACRQFNGSPPERREAACACLTDRAGRELSRHDRILLKGVITEDYQMIAGLMRSALDSNVITDDSPQARAADEARFHALIDGCLK